MFCALFNIVEKGKFSIAMIGEVICDQEYNFYMDEPYVMFDIGSNMGVASLYFSRNEYIKKSIVLNL